MGAKVLWMFSAIMLFLALIPSAGTGNFTSAFFLSVLLVINVTVVWWMVEQDNKRYG